MYGKPHLVGLGHANKSHSSQCSEEKLGFTIGTAKVRLASGARLDMQDLKIGDKVQVVDKAGKVAYEDVYFFGHRDRTVLAPFVRLHLQARCSSRHFSQEDQSVIQQHPAVPPYFCSSRLLASKHRNHAEKICTAMPTLSPVHNQVVLSYHFSASMDAVYAEAVICSAGRGIVSKSLDISRHHFVYVRRGQEQTTAMRAKDVRVGDLLQINDDDVVRDAWVVAIESVTRQGLWNPYTLSGRIVVDDVAVSAHSEWLLDPILDYLAGTHLLPAVYQVTFCVPRRQIMAIQMLALDGFNAFCQLPNTL